MTEHDLTRLLDAAVPPIPSEFADAPYPSIRRRARRRRAVATAVACGAVAVAVGVVAAGIAVAPWRGAAPPAPAAPTTPVTGAAVALSVSVARVDRAGTGLTLFANEDRARCLEYPNATAAVDERPDVVVVAVTGTGTHTDCGSAGATPVTVTLRRPLGDRRLVDGAGASIRPFFDADLPMLPAAWTVTPNGSYGGLDGTWFSLLYYRDINAPWELLFNIWTQPPDHPGNAGEVTLGSRTGSLFVTGAIAGVRWQVRDLTYQLRLVPNEGQDGATVDQVRTLIDEFTWP